MLTADEKLTCLTVASNAIRHEFKLALADIDSNAQQSPRLQKSGASFVTLRIRQHLRGCIGSLQAYQPLLEDIKNNAIAAAFRDPRFPPLTLDELKNIQLEISILSPHYELSFKNESELLSLLQPGVDGLIIRQGAAHATFLPSVWESLPEPVEFLSQLKKKAGIESTGGFAAWRYSTESFSDAR